MTIDLSQFNDIRDDSRLVKKGDIFVAVKGELSDGHDFIEAAIQNGAKAIIHEKNHTASAVEGVEFYPADDSRLMLAQLCAEKYTPIPPTIAAVTGTSGKSSVVELLRQIWDTAGVTAAALGTLGVRCGSLQITDVQESNHLTSMACVALHKMLQKLSHYSVTHVALEASSHGLLQKRLHGLRFSAAAFTNLSRDHLDYHKDMESYFQAKAILFRELLATDAPIVALYDSDRFSALQDIATATNRKLYGFGSGGDIRLLELHESVHNITMKVDFFGKMYHCHLPLMGEFQAYNFLAAAGMAHLLGTHSDVIFGATEGLRGIKGRMQKIACDFGTVIVDYAHKPEALRMALQALRPYVAGELIVVFGCGGDRDKGKRPQMGAIAAEHADYTIITDDNPRSEAPATIRKEIIGGMGAGEGEGYEEIGNRAEAIAYGLERLKQTQGSVLLIAGKGHESGQTMGGKTLPFDDVDVTESLLRGQ